MLMFGSRIRLVWADKSTPPPLPPLLRYHRLVQTPQPHVSALLGLFLKPLFLQFQYHTNSKDLGKYLIPGTRCCCPRKKKRKKINSWRHALRKNGFRKKIATIKYFLPILDAIAKFWLITQRKN